MTINLHQITSFIKHYFTAKRKGHSVHSPFAYQLCEEVFYNTNSFYDFKLLNSLRKALQNDTTTFQIEDFGAGSKTFKTNTRNISSTAKQGISTQLQSEIFYKLINFLNCRVIVELGTSLGLNTLYLSLANKNGWLTTIEGSKELSLFAKRLAAQNNSNNIHFINAKFDDALPVFFKENTVVDFFYVDGNHTYEATINYFNLALPHKTDTSVFVFDDIYWSKDMTRAWEEIKKNKEVTLSIDTFYFGLVFFKPELKEKVNLKFYI
ncbi:MAG: class I SAM-dependent methyltransferase [Bacteroidota bacterium]|nr:class I SAM-dependent methyltransferase [Bacteroidota bacterium]